MRKIVVGYILTLVFLTVFSYGFIDPNFPYQPPNFLHQLVYQQRTLTTIIYIIIVSLLFGVYGSVLWMERKKKITSKEIWQLIAATTAVLFFSFPAFSFDIFNYIATAKVTFFYRENPYIVMPIEIPNEPMLAFMHAANKTALYGPSWILLTAIPYFLGFGNLFFTIFTFKAFILFFYLGLIYLIWLLSQKNLFSLTFFALNPLVITESLVSSHNDVVMMFFALLCFYLLKKKKFLLSVICFLLSVLLKFATLFLLPVYLYLIYLKLKDQKVVWQKIWQWSAFLMFLVFLLSPLREELYAWYFIWILPFVALSLKRDYFIFSIFFSLGLLLRIAPFLYWRSWAGLTPLLKKGVTWGFGMLGVVAVFVLRRRRRYEKVLV